MRPVTVAQIRYAAILIAAIVAIPGQLVLSSHDAIFLATLVAAAGLIWRASNLRTWLVALAIVTPGLVWGSVDPHGCAIGVRIRLVYEKLAGHVPYIDWDEIARIRTSACFAADDEAGRSIRKLDERPPQGRSWERYETPLGRFWVPAGDRETLQWLIWEITAQHDYSSGDIGVKPGDVVIDGGAHVGVFTRYALSRDASQVVAIEPAPENTALLEANLEAEIASGRVRLVKAGLWHKRDALEFTTGDSSAQGSFVAERHGAKIQVPVRPLDDLVSELKLERVHFIKMDIEGAERQALLGASRTLREHRPRMAICTYHLKDDSEAVPTLVLRIEPHYRVHAKDFETGVARYTTKAMFFEVR